jgi:hypothetical protein
LATPTPLRLDESMERSTQVTGDSSSEHTCTTPPLPTATALDPFPAMATAAYIWLGTVTTGATTAPERVPTQRFP